MSLKLMQLRDWVKIAARSIRHNWGLLLSQLERKLAGQLQVRTM